MEGGRMRHSNVLHKGASRRTQAAATVMPRRRRLLQGVRTLRTVTPPTSGDGSGGVSRKEHFQHLKAASCRQLTEADGGRLASQVAFGRRHGQCQLELAAVNEGL